MYIYDTYLFNFIHLFLFLFILSSLIILSITSIFFTYSFLNLDFF